jgi:hypothetical protein
MIKEDKKESNSPSQSPRSGISDRKLFSIKWGSGEAKGYETNDGFKVLKDSQAARHESPNLKNPGHDLRREIIEKGILVSGENCLVFTQDYHFDSPSAAAGVVTGKNGSGREKWINGEGRTLKQVQDER